MALSIVAACQPASQSPPDEATSLAVVAVDAPDPASARVPAVGEPAIETAVLPAEKSHAPHVHGTADVSVTIASERLSVTLESPLGDLLGFERLPQTSEEEAALAALEAGFRQTGSILALPAKAACQLTGATARVEMHAGHAGLLVEQDFACTEVSAIREITIAAFSEYPGLGHIDLIVLTPTDQFAADLTAANPSLTLRR